jgi:hypothetical protein
MICMFARMLERRRDWLIGGAAALSLAGPALAAGSVSSLLACREIADSGQRLACFDREAAALAPAPATAAKTPAPAPAPVAATPPRAAPAATDATPAPPSNSAAASAAPARDARQDFGLSPALVEKQEIAAGARPVKVSSIEAHIVRTAHTSEGHLVFTLDNDQVWRQILAEDMLVRPGEAVTISRAMLNSFWLKMSSGRGCKVTRVR